MDASRWRGLKHRSRRRGTVAAALAAVAAAFVPAFAAGQQPTAASPRDSTIRYRYDRERYLYPSPEAELAQRARIWPRLKELESVVPHTTESAGALLRTLVLMDSLAAEAKRHTTYLYLRTETNTLDRASAEAHSAIDAQASAASRDVRAQLQRVSHARLDQFIRERPALENYRFVVKAARRYAPHTLSPAQEAVFSRLAPVASAWPLAFYDQAMARIKFGTVQSPSGPLHVYRQRGAIANSPDSAVRNAGSRLLWDGYNSERDLFATALIGTVRARHALATEHHFDGGPAEVYFRAWLTTADITAMIARVRSRAELSKRYQRLLAAHARWIGTQPRTGTPFRRPQLSVDSASRLIEAVLAPLGPAYQRELAALLDPSNGRLDMSGGQHRASGGASFGSGVTTSGVFLNTFEGFPADVSRLAHEAGHAVENQFHFVGHVSPAYANGPVNGVGADFLSEAYALFNELVLKDAQLQLAANDTEKQFQLIQFLSQAMEPYYGAQDADLEQSIHDGVTSGRVATADQLDSLTRDVDLAYDITSETRPELRARWITRRVMIEDPVYFFNYMYSGLLSLKLFERYSLDRARFVPRYLELVRAGYHAAPTDALKRVLGIDLTDPKLLDDAVALIEARVNELAALFANQEARVGSGQRP